jgi:hypothetical protein
MQVKMSPNRKDQSKFIPVFRFQPPSLRCQQRGARDDSPCTSKAGRCGRIDRPVETCLAGRKTAGQGELTVLLIEQNRARILRWSRHHFRSNYGETALMTAGTSF